MRVTDGLVSQAIVLMTILAGFASVIGAEITTKDKTSSEMLPVTFRFFLVGLLSLGAVILGLLYFGASNLPEFQYRIGSAMVFMTLIAIPMFLYSMVFLAGRKFGKPTRDDAWILIAIVAAFTVFLILSSF